MIPLLLISWLTAGFTGYVYLNSLFKPKDQIDWFFSGLCIVPCAFFGPLSLILYFIIKDEI